MLNPQLDGVLRVLEHLEGFFDEFPLGNGVLLKPSEETPRLGDLLGDLFNTCSLPPNLFTVIQGDGSVGAGLIAARPDKVFFTGSVATGRMVMAAAAAHPVPVCLEMGGVDAMIVCEDADLELASSAAVWGGTFNHGQVCASVERLLVHESIADEVQAKFVEGQIMVRLILKLDDGALTGHLWGTRYQFNPNTQQVMSVRATAAEERAWVRV